MSVTDATAQVREEWRHADIKSCADTLPLSEYEQLLSKHEHDGGRMTPTRTSRTRWRRCVTAWRRADMRSCAEMTPLSEYEQPLPIRESDAGRMTVTRTSRTRGAGASQHSDTPTWEPDMTPLSEYEQTLSIREHDAGCRDDA